MTRCLTSFICVLTVAFVWASGVPPVAEAGRQSVDSPLGPPVATFRVDVFEILVDVNEATGDVIDFEAFSEGSALGQVTTRTNTVTFSVNGKNSPAYVAGVGLPLTAFHPEDSPDPDTFAARRFLTDEPAGPTVGNDYYLRFEKPITSLSLDLYDFRGDGGPQIGDTAILKIYADDNYKTLVGQAIYKIEGHETDQNVVRLKVKLDCVAARSARLAFSKPDDGTGIDNVTFETAIAATSPKAFGKLPQGVGPQPAVPARPLDAPLNHGLVASCYTANLRSPIDMRESAITPLMIAASAGDSPTLQRLIRAGANPNLRDSSAWTALTYSSVAERPAALEVLIAAGADPNALSITGQTAIMAAASANKPPSFLQPLIAAGANVNAQDADGFTALMLTGNRDAAELLLRAGADPNLRSSAGQTAMMLNAGPADASIDMLRLLVNSGADINAQDNLGQTALMLLVMRRSPAAGDTPLSEDGVDIKRLSAAVSLLKRAGARTDLRDASGRTVLDRLELEQQAVMRNLELVRSDLSGKSIRDARSNVAKWYEQLRETLAR